jgi:hypothetical protein
MCVCTLLNANPVVERVGAYALEGKKTAFRTWFRSEHPRIEWSLALSLFIGSKDTRWGALPRQPSRWVAYTTNPCNTLT